MTDRDDLDKLLRDHGGLIGLTRQISNVEPGEPARQLKALKRAA